MRAVFSKIAKHELDDAISYYELEFEGLGKQFKSNVKSSINRILRYPHAWPIERGGEIRNCLMSKFPYKILYSIENDQIFSKYSGLVITNGHRLPILSRNFIFSDF